MYQIGWDDAAIDGLATLSLLHQGRWADINGAVDIIEYRLQRTPMAYSREVSEGITFTMSGNDITIESIGWMD